jgi:hypothetical protein
LSDTHQRRCLIFATIFVQCVLATATYGAMVAAERTAWPVFANLDRALVFADVPKYYQQASNAFAGQIPYRQSPVEYPLLALPFVFLPRLFVSTQRAFVLLFAAEMLLANAIIVWSVAREIENGPSPARLGGRLVWLTACFVCVAPFVIGRFDAIPALVAFLGASWWYGRRPILGGLAAGLGTLVKIVPGAVAIPGLMSETFRERPWRGRGSLAFVGSLVVATAVWFTIGGRGMWDAVRYHSGRGIEIGSVYSGVLYFAARLDGSQVRTSFDHESTNLSGGWSRQAAALALPIQACVLGLVGWRFWRSGMREPMRFGGAAVLAFAATGKVLSPQYLIWVIPFAAICEGSAGRLVRIGFLFASLTTMLLYPWSFAGLCHLETGPFVLLNLRNGLLLGTLGIWLFAPSVPEPPVERRDASRIRTRARARDVMIRESV